MEKFLKMLGCKATDRVTGFAGVVTSVSFDLYGCVQCIVTPEVTKSDKGQQQMEDSRWFDAKRLEIADAAPVMPVPDFAADSYREPGPAHKPAFPSQPAQ